MTTHSGHAGPLRQAEDQDGPRGAPEDTHHRQQRQPSVERNLHLLAGLLGEQRTGSVCWLVCQANYERRFLSKVAL